MVFFDNAIYNVFFLRRIIYKSVGGHGILIRLGSSGRTSYAKIASDLCGFTTNIFNGAGMQTKVYNFIDIDENKRTVLGLILFLCIIISSVLIAGILAYCLDKKWKILKRRISLLKRMMKNNLFVF